MEDKNTTLVTTIENVPTTFVQDKELDFNKPVIASTEITYKNGDQRVGAFIFNRKSSFDEICNLLKTYTKSRIVIEEHDFTISVEVEELLVNIRNISEEELNFLKHK